MKIGIIKKKILKILNSINNIDKYQIWTNNTAIYKTLNNNISIKEIYPLLGLMGETGELIDKIKKNYRNNNGLIDPIFRKSIGYELGDILYYLAQTALLFNFKLSEVAEMNKAKLLDRQKRNIICSQGDNR